MDRIYSGHGLVRPMVRTRLALFCLLVGLLGGSPRRDTARRCTQSFGMTHAQPTTFSNVKFAKAGNCDRHHSRKSLINGMVNDDRHPTPRLPVVTLPQACPPALGAFYRGMRVATAGLLGLCPRARSSSRPRALCHRYLGRPSTRVSVPEACADPSF
jgi:hypothetical protein